ncbi:MAG: DNA cytosine methyltransferase [Gemmataceae bacterium]
MAKRSARPRKRPVAIDLFCGAGGMSLGFEQAGFDVLLGVDADGHHVAAHARNFPHSVALCRSIVDLDADGVYAALGGKIALDLVFGGPPCQGFSHMGLRDSADPRNDLVEHFARLVAELQPRAFVMENVPGMLSGKTRPLLDRTIRFLTEAGYRITFPVRVLDAAAFGVPQKRKRLFLLGLRGDRVWTIPYPTEPCPGQPPRPSVWEAIGDLPDVDNREELFACDETEYDKPPRSAYAKVARGRTDDPSDYSHPREWSGLRCTGCLRVRHTERAAAVYAATPPGQTVPGHKLPRLDPEGIAPTLRAGSDSTHGSYTAPRPIHPRQPRCITAREAARLHGFPDWFGFYPLKWHAYRQIGNAVCPPVARAIGREVLRALGYSPIAPAQYVSLSDEFMLPEDRPRTRKRIPHIVHYPPVVKYLFDGAYDAVRGEMRHARFTFADVQKAIAATGVNLAWSRADTFVSEIARSRNVTRILAPCLSKGYSIRAIREGAFIGEFVPVGEPGTVDDKDAIHVRSRDVADAVLVAPSAVSIDPQAAHTLPTLLLHESVVRSLWQGRKLSVVLGQPAHANDNGLQVDYALWDNGVPIGGGSSMVSTLRHLPTRSRIGRLARGADTDEVIVFVALTARHVLATRLEGCRETPREACRQVYEIAP